MLYGLLHWKRCQQSFKGREVYNCFLSNAFSNGIHSGKRLELTKTLLKTVMERDREMEKDRPKKAEYITRSEMDTQGKRKGQRDRLDRETGWDGVLSGSCCSWSHTVADQSIRAAVLLAQWHKTNHRVGFKFGTCELLTFNFQTKNILCETVIPGSAQPAKQKQGLLTWSNTLFSYIRHQCFVDITREVCKPETTPHQKLTSGSDSTK